MTLVYALILTILIEGITMYVLTHSKEWVRFNLYCNMVTNPVLNLIGMYVINRWGMKTGSYYYVIGEVLVILAESALYVLMSQEETKTCMKRSLITNGISVGLGALLQMLT